MPELPAVGTRVSLRYRLPTGSVPPLTDVVGHLLDAGPTLTIRTRRGDLVNVAVSDVVAVKGLSDAPVRTGDIRNLEQAAALAWPGTEQEWLGGWLLRFGHGSTRRANSAVPLEFSTGGDLRAVIGWYDDRGMTPLISAPDRLFHVPQDVPTVAETVVMTRRLAAGPAVAASTVTMASAPDDEWRRLYRRDVPVDVLTAVVDGEAVFATAPGAAAGRCAVTRAPDGTRWAGLSAVHVVEEARGRGVARTLCDALLAWSLARGATRAYVQVLADNVVATKLYASMGFGVHHRSRYVDARTL